MMKVLMATWNKGVYIYAASLVGRQERRNEVVIELGRHFSS